MKSEEQIKRFWRWRGWLTKKPTWKPSGPAAVITAVEFPARGYPLVYGEVINHGGFLKSAGEWFQVDPAKFDNPDGCFELWLFDHGNPELAEPITLEEARRAVQWRTHREHIPGCVVRRENANVNPGDPVYRCFWGFPEDLPAGWRVA